MGYHADGRRRRKRIYGETKAAVAARLREMQVALDRGQVPEAGALTLGQYLDTWLEAAQSSIAPNTLVDYSKNVRKLREYVGGTKLAKLTALRVQQMYADMERGGVPRASQRRAGVTLGIALQHAVRLRLIPHNVARDVPKPRVPRRQIEPLGPDEVGRFLDAARADRLYALYVIWLDSGAREGELFGLTWDSVDFPGRAITVKRNLEEIKGRLTLREVKTSKSRRRIPVSEFAIDALNEHRKAMLAEGNFRPDGPVFCDSRGGWLRKSNVLRRSFRPALKRAGLPLTTRPYDLRHSSATLLLLAGEDAKVVAERLGHSTTRLTQDIYQHVLPGMQERAAAKLDAIFRQPSAPQTLRA
jgi:integrase